MILFIVGACLVDIRHGSLIICHRHYYHQSNHHRDRLFFFFFPSGCDGVWMALWFSRQLLAFLSSRENLDHTWIRKCALGGFL